MRVKQLLFALSLASLVGPSAGATWNVMTLLRGASEVTYFDADTVHRRDGDVRMKIESIRDLDANRHEGIYKTQEWRTYHCKARTLSVTDIVAYDRQGQVMRQLPDRRVTAVAPHDSELDTLTDICAATFPKAATGGSFELVRGNDPEVDAYRYFEKARAEIMARWPWPSSRMPPERVDCSPIHFRYAATLADLTPELREAAHTSGMADRGRDFNSTDAIRPGRPDQRYAGGAIGESRAFVAFEQGGIVSNTEIWSLEKSGSGWHGKVTWYASGPTDTLAGLLSSTCVQQSARKEVIFCDDPRDKVVGMTYVGDRRVSYFDLVPSRVPRGVSPHDLVVDHNGGELTDDERRNLLSRLTSTRDKEVKCARASLDRFIVALGLQLQAR